MKKLIRLTEGDLHKIVKESVNRILREDANFNKDILDGISEVCDEIQKKFELDKYDMSFHGSVQNDQIVFQLDNTAIYITGEDPEVCSWEMFKDITSSIYEYLTSLGIKINGRPRMRKRGGDWVDEEMFAFIYAEMYIPDEYMERGAETRRLHIEKSKAAKAELERKRAELERKKAEQLRAKEEEKRQKEIERQKVLPRIKPPTDKVKKQMDDMWKQHDKFSKSKTDEEMKQMWDWQKRHRKQK